MAARCVQRPLSSIPCLRTAAPRLHSVRARTAPRSSCTSATRQYAMLVSRTRTRLPQRLPAARSQRRRAGGIPFTGSMKENLKILVKHHPVAVPVCFLTIFGAVCFIFWLDYFYLFHDMPRYANYPEDVIKYLRRAIYYTNIDLDVRRAQENYLKAMDKAKETGMDYYSDEVLGIRFMMSHLFEKANNLPIAVRILEVIRGELISQSETSLTNPDDVLAPDERQKRRTRLLSKAVGVSLKLTELYANPYVHRDSDALDVALWAVDTCMRESAVRRSTGATTDTHGQWLTADEFGASLEALAHRYEVANAHFLAAPLFLQALNVKERTDCHSVTLMNNLSISLAQQDPPPERGVPPPSRDSLVQSGIEWAERALRVAEQVEGEARTEECDEACAVATHNIGEFREMLGDPRGAADMYRTAKKLAKDIGFVEGRMQSEASLKRLAEKDALHN